MFPVLTEVKILTSIQKTSFLHENVNPLSNGELDLSLWAVML
jgi:hypothetical protein